MLHMSRVIIPPKFHKYYDDDVRTVIIFDWSLYSTLLLQMKRESLQVGYRLNIDTNTYITSILSITIKVVKIDSSNIHFKFVDVRIQRTRAKQHLHERDEFEFDEF